MKNKGVDWKKITLGILIASCMFGAVESVAAQEIKPRVVAPGVQNSAFDGYWRLRWRDRGGLVHRGRLFMNGNFGKLIVNVRLPNGRLIAAEQEMTLISSRNQYILRGVSSTYPGTNHPNPDYIPDTFEIRPYGHSLSVKNCSFAGCYRVNMNRIRNRASGF